MSVQTEQTITSLEVAVLTGKNHKEVLRDIRIIISQLGEGGLHNFVETSYTDSWNREQTCYRLTKEGWEIKSTSPILDPLNTPTYPPSTSKT